MSDKFRIPVTAITVFSTSLLLAASVATVLYLGFNRAAQSTQQLWADQSEAIINSMEQSLEYQLKPVRDQAQWVAEDISDLSNLSIYDEYMLGTLAAVKQVAGVALVTKAGFSRRWHRGSRKMIDEDWSGRPEIVEWIQQVEAENKPAWRTPIWVEQPVGAMTLLHDIPIYNAKHEFIGAFAQIVTIAKLSSVISRKHTRTGLTPFILYNKNYVLGHPMLMNNLSSRAEERILPSIDSFDDIILSRIWTPDDSADFFSAALTDIEANGVFWGDKFYIYLYRNVNQYGPAPWTIGAYLNTSLIGEDELKNLIKAIAGGLLTLLIAILASVYIGQLVGRPVKAIAIAAKAVESGDLLSVPRLKADRIREIDDANSAFNNMISGLKERELIRKTLGRFVPEEVASSLLDGGGNITPKQTEASILFCDIEAFTQLTETLGPGKIADVLNAYFSDMVTQLEQYGGVVTQFQGDAILATFNVPISNPDHATNAIYAACKMIDHTRQQRFAGQQLNIRIGINSGTVFAGAIGAEGRLNYTVHGDAVNLASRLEALNKEYGTRLLISDNTRILTDNLKLVKLDETRVRGQSDSIDIYTLPSYNG
ncbi:MAG: adenylate/guanylate cyclase domain-containing protein [Gammaproteobacteria bacterium]|nr:adenylate/guanylate cyclase domain-containing protein [Gammaproteobacteria bacterium]